MNAVKIVTRTTSIFDIQKGGYQICTQLLLFLHSKCYASKLCWIFIASFYNCICIEYPDIQKRLNTINRFEPVTYSVPLQSYHLASMWLTWRLFISMLPLEIQLSMRKCWGSSTGLTPCPTFRISPMPGPGFPTRYVLGVLCVQSPNTRGEFLLCW